MTPVIHDLSGQQFGRLKILNITSKRARGNVVWHCQCTCGNYIDVNASDLVVGHTRSCGCLRSEFAKSKTIGFGKAAFNSIYNAYKQRAKIKGQEFHLSKDNFKILIDSNCYYCGIQPSQISSYYTQDTTGQYTYNGIDRKDSNLGYTLENCVPCCKTCNYGKRNLPYSEFISYLHRIADKYNKVNQESEII